MSSCVWITARILRGAKRSTDYFASVRSQIFMSGCQMYCCNREFLDAELSNNLPSFTPKALSYRPGIVNLQVNVILSEHILNSHQEYFNFSTYRQNSMHIYIKCELKCRNYDRYGGTARSAQRNVWSNVRARVFHICVVSIQDDVFISSAHLSSLKMDKFTG